MALGSLHSEGTTCGPSAWCEDKRRRHGNSRQRVNGVGEMARYLAALQQTRISFPALPWQLTWQLTTVGNSSSRELWPSWCASIYSDKIIMLNTKQKTGRWEEGKLDSHRFYSFSSKEIFTCCLLELHHTTSLSVEEVENYPSSARQSLTNVNQGSGSDRRCGSHWVYHHHHGLPQKVLLPVLAAEGLSEWVSLGQKVT